MNYPLDLVRKIGQEENLVAQGNVEFISPVYENRTIAATVQRLLYKFYIPKIKPGWYIFKAVDFEKAKVVREADFIEIENYLKNFSKIRLTTTHKVDGIYYGLPQKNNSIGKDFKNPVPIYLTDDTIMDFDKIIGRCDGPHIWFESVDIKNDFTKSTYLRESYEKMRSPEDIRFSGLSIEEKLAYAFRFAIDKEIKIKMQSKGLEDSVKHAGGNLLSYSELSDSFKVTYTVGRQQFTSYVSKDNGYSVITAGICLSGHDKKFDLASLISVLLQGQREGLINRE